jgi:hypothetical protein
VTEFFSNISALVGSWVIAFVFGHLTGATVVSLIKSTASKFLPK